MAYGWMISGARGGGPRRGSARWGFGSTKGECEYDGGRGNHTGSRRRMIPRGGTGVKILARAAQGIFKRIQEADRSERRKRKQEAENEGE